MTNLIATIKSEHTKYNLTESTREAGIKPEARLDTFYVRFSDIFTVVHDIIAHPHKNNMR